MSQQLIPISGGIVPQVQTKTASSPLNILSSQYTQAKGLQSRPTEWVPGGRPIYRRLPSTGQTYQTDFFNIVNEGASGYRAEEFGGVYVPWGNSSSGLETVEVTSSESKDSLLIKGGEIVWKYGKNSVLPTIVNLRVLDILSGQYDVVYQLIYDDSPISELYEVKEFALTGLPLNISSSTDLTVGWRYPAVNAFLNSSNLFWSNKDSFFAAYAQPTFSFLRWESELPQAYRSVVLRCPPNTAYAGSATLSYLSESALVPVKTVKIARDSLGQFFEFTIDDPILQTGWNVSFSSLDMSISLVTVSGAITLLQPQAALSPRANLAIYPVGTLPSTTVNAKGEVIPAVYCKLAEIDVTSDFKVSRIEDTRIVFRRDYVPVADWLTLPFDQDLINLYEQVSEYTPLWMTPSSCMKGEYEKLSTAQIEVKV